MTADVVLGGLGAGIVVVAGTFYLVEVLRGRARPHAGSWLVWTVIGVLGFGATNEAGAGPGAWAAAVYVVLYAVTFLLAMMPRFGKRTIERYDWPLCACAIIGAILWRLGVLPGTGAVVLAVACDAAGLWPTLREAWNDPSSESLPAWAGDTAGNLLCLFAVGRPSIATILYPAYLLAATASVASVLLWRHRRPREADAEPAAA